MCWEIGPVVAVDMCCDLCTQYHVLVQLDGSHHHIYCLDKLKSYTLTQNSEEWAGQPVEVDAAS